MIRRKLEDLSPAEKKWICSRPLRILYKTEAGYEKALLEWIMKCPDDAKYKGGFSQS